MTYTWKCNGKGGGGSPANFPTYQFVESQRQGRIFASLFPSYYKVSLKEIEFHSTCQSAKCVLYKFKCLFHKTLLQICNSRFGEINSAYCDNSIGCLFVCLLLEVSLGEVERVVRLFRVMSRNWPNGLAQYNELNISRKHQWTHGPAIHYDFLESAK